jgi:hypothetical protein
MPKPPTRRAAALKATIDGLTAVDTEGSQPPQRDRGSRIMYLENKSGALDGEGRIGRVTHSKTKRSIYYQGRRFQSLNGQGFKANYFDVESGESYWISGPKRNGRDRLYGGASVPIDEDVREEYWMTIRKQPERVDEKCT